MTERTKEITDKLRGDIVRMMESSNAVAKSKGDEGSQSEFDFFNGRFTAFRDALRELDQAIEKADRL